MANEIEISNLALMMLGQSSIISFYDGTDKANLCEAFYPQVRDEVLRAHPWNCARVRVQLAALGASPVYGFTYQYQLPTDPYCLKVLDVNDDSSVVWRIEQRTLVTDEGEVYITYTGRVDHCKFDNLSSSGKSTFVYAAGQMQTRGGHFILLP